MPLPREKLVAVFRVLVGFGLLLVMIAFLRACFSPPPLPPPPVPGAQPAPGEDTLRYGTLPPGY